MTLLYILMLWLLVSLIVGIIVGKFIKFGMGEND